MTPSELKVWVKEQQAVILADMKDMQAKSVEGVHVPAKLLTDKEREAFHKTTLELEHGRNPYNHGRMKDMGKNLGGAIGPIEKLIDYEALERDAVEAHTTLQAKWSDRTLPVEYDVLILEDAYWPDTPTKVVHPPGTLICSYCGVKVDRSTSTIGRGRPNFSQVVVNIDPSVPSFDMEWLVRNKQVVACPDCCLKVEKVKFPETDG